MELDRRRNHAVLVDKAGKMEIEKIETDEKLFAIERSHTVG